MQCVLMANWHVLTVHPLRLPNAEGTPLCKPPHLLAHLCIVRVQIVTYMTKDRFKQNRKKTFKGHNTAGYACQVNFSPDSKYVMSGACAWGLPFKYRHEQSLLCVCYKGVLQAPAEHRPFCGDCHVRCCCVSCCLRSHSLLCVG